MAGAANAQTPEDIEAERHEYYQCVAMQEFDATTKAMTDEEATALSRELILENCPAAPINGEELSVYAIVGGE